MTKIDETRADSGAKKALVIVDVQRDFLPGGALGVPDGDEVIPEIEKLVALGEYDLIVTTADAHPSKTKHFDKWPVHAVKGTPGAQLDPRIRVLGEAHITKGDSTEDDGYSAFEGFNIPTMKTLAELLAGADEVHVVGLATDYCVRATALDAVKAGFDTTVLRDATRPVDPVTGAEAEVEMGNAGVKLA